jgi:ATP-dependent helicase STH1/SNF2
MKQIKRRIDKDPTYSLATLKSDMHLLWDNARTYNQEGSWVFDAADTMQEEFDKMYDDIVAAAASSSAGPSGNAGPSGPTGGEGSQVPSGSSTPMFKAGAGGGIGKIKLNFGTKLKEQSQAPAQSVGTASLTGEDSGQDDDEDDDY